MSKNVEKNNVLKKTMSCQKMSKNNVMSKKCHVKNLGSLIKKMKKRKSNHLSKLTNGGTRFLGAWVSGDPNFFRVPDSGKKSGDPKGQKIYPDPTVFEDF